MGTGRPRVEITAATLAGGTKNQDRYAYGDGWAFVLDGASSFDKTQPEHDGGWYAEHLKHALSAGLKDRSERTTPAIVEDAIREVAEAHGGDAVSCPTSTIALARWDDETVEAYLLGDSTVALISDKAEEVFSDTRLADIAQPIREEYKSRLVEGYGFDVRHRTLLQQLQAQQAAARNLPGGYWIAGADPEAAHQGVTCKRERRLLRSIILATDGGAAGVRYGLTPTWSAMTRGKTDLILRRIHQVEDSDPTAVRWPRSKQHDDKTAVIVGLSTDY